MRPSADVRIALDALFDPVFVVEEAGAILFANEPARRRFGAAERLFDTVAVGSAEALSRLLGRAVGSTKPLLGGVEVPETGRVRIVANRLSADANGEAPLVMVRFAMRDLDRFGALSAKVAELDVEVRQRRHVEARLRETLAERELLLRELHHRVKNNVQMIMAMVGAARRDATDPEAQRILVGAETRLAAVAAAQQMLYRGDGLTGLDADAFLRAVTGVVLRAHASNLEPTLTGCDTLVDNDLVLPLALALNELVANALKHAPGAPLAITLEADAEVFRLTVKDDGPGFEPAETGRRSSGLGLVRGLVRQVGGAMRIDNDGGARAVVELRRQPGLAQEVGP